MVPIAPVAEDKPPNFEIGKVKSTLFGHTPVEINPIYYLPNMAQSHFIPHLVQPQYPLQQRSLKHFIYRIRLSLRRC